MSEMKILRHIMFFLLFPAGMFCAHAEDMSGGQTGKLVVSTSAPENGKLEFIYRIPKKYNSESRIMILFGGRNWPAVQTLERYKFNEFADRHGLFLLSPSFRNDDYWEPEKWSGKALFQAVAELEKRFILKSGKLYFYGYSAGGQCVALFYDYAPERVGAWALHASGVYFNAKGWKKPFAPGLITCGTDDAERFQISRSFIFNFRESGGDVIWVPYRDRGHELTDEALEIARQFFEDRILGCKSALVGDDDTRQTFPATDENISKIEVEYRNYLTSEKLAELWRNCR